MKQPPPSARISEESAGEESAGRAPDGQRLRREMRLRSPLEFARVRREGRRVSGPLLTISYTRRATRAEVPQTRIRSGMRCCLRELGFQ